MGVASASKKVDYNSRQPKSNTIALSVKDFLHIPKYFVIS